MAVYGASRTALDGSACCSCRRVNHNSGTTILHSIASNELSVANNSQDIRKTVLPAVEFAVQLLPLLLAKDTVDASIDNDGFVELIEFGLDQTSTNDINNPHLHFSVCDL